MLNWQEESIWLTRFVLVGLQEPHLADRESGLVPEDVWAEVEILR